MLNFVACQKKVTDYPIQPVNFTQVHLADSFWSPKLSINREVSIPTAFHQCEINGRLDNFALAAKELPTCWQCNTTHSSTIISTVSST